MTWIIGNGESRINIDLDCLDGVKVGCNAIIREYEVDHLVCVDKRMLNEAANKKTKSTVYTRHDWYRYYKQEFYNLKLVPELPYNGTQRPDDPFHWGSGPYAVLIGAKLSARVNLIGFDLYSNTLHVNNVYKDTANYDKSNKRAVDPRYWIYQIGKVFEHFDAVKFRIFQSEDWQLPKNWTLSNVEVDNIDNIC